jgi:hypothetical protein
VYGLLLNFINAEKNSKEWDTMPNAQQQGLLDPIEELDKNDGIDHKSVLDKYKAKYA